MSHLKGGRFFLFGNSCKILLFPYNWNLSRYLFKFFFVLSIAHERGEVAWLSLFGKAETQQAK